MKVLQNAMIRQQTIIFQCQNFWGMVVLSMCYSAYRIFVTPLSFKFATLFCIFLLLFPMRLYSNGIELDNAKQIAAPFLNGNKIVLIKSTSTYYILGAENNIGFVIVANNDSIDNPILGYSETNGWIEERMPPIILRWLDSLDHQSKELSNRSKKFSSRALNSGQRESVPILMTSHWHQDSPYNNMCPVITDGNIKTAAGCVAIASAQVVYYWRKDNPQTTSEDTPTYPYGKAPVTYSVPAGTEYRWDLMKDYYSLYESEEEQESVARLAYIIGTSTYLQYGTSTGGQINDIINPFSKQFRLNAKYASKKNYSQEEWEQLIYDNLKKKQPVIYAGSTGADAHAVVIDGYNAATNLFHFNFGWGGNGDGYYTIDDTSGMNGYIFGQECVCDIFPRQRNLTISFTIEDDLIANTLGEILFSVQNASTFDINGLYLFVSKNLIYPTDKGDAFWYKEDLIKNDGSNHSFSVQFTPSYSGSRCYLILTDGDMNILAQKNIIIQESSGIDEISIADKHRETFYSIDGSLLRQKPSKGIYIRKSKDRSTKVVVSK